MVHELAHLLWLTHNAHFVELLDRFLPKWQHHHEILNRLLVRQETWAD